MFVRVIFLIMSTQSLQDDASLQSPFDLQENFKAFGENILYSTYGGPNQVGCGIGCLKCDSLSSANMKIYNEGEPSRYSKRVCMACDWKNGYGLVEGGQCVKTNMEKCFKPVNYLISHSLFDNGQLPTVIPC